MSSCGALAGAATATMSSLRAVMMWMVAWIRFRKCLVGRGRGLQLVESLQIVAEGSKLKY